MTTPNRTAMSLAAAIAIVLGGAVVRADELKPCGDEKLGPRARCGSYAVPEDRSRPGGRQIELHVVVLTAAAPGNHEPVFMLAGGPGQAASDLVGLALGPFAPVNEGRDFVFVDQRGTGDSNPLRCPNGSADDPQRAFGGLFDPKRMADCLKQWSRHADVRLYTTSQVVADLDDLRARLGYDKVILWGGSGGTRTALVWMREHPEHVAAALLDGVTPTDFRAPSTMARSSQEALDKVFADCKVQTACRDAFPDLAGDFARLLARFDGGPVATHVTRDDGKQVPVEMYRGDFGYAVRGMLYQARLITSLPKLIHQAATTGDLSPFAQALWQRDVALRPVVAMGVHFAVDCAEDLPFVDRAATAKADAGTFLGDYLMEQYGAICKIWPAVSVPASYLEPTRTDTPTLIFSGAYDPSTPARFGDEAARNLPASRHVVARNEAHGSEFGCGRMLAIDFLSKGTLEGLAPACEEVGTIEFEAP